MTTSEAKAELDRINEMVATGQMSALDARPRRAVLREILAFAIRSSLTTPAPQETPSTGQQEAIPRPRRPKRKAHPDDKYGTVVYGVSLPSPHAH